MSLVDSLLRLAIALLIVGALFTAVERLWPARGRADGAPRRPFLQRPLLRRGLGVDVGWWFFTGLITRNVSRIVVGGGILAALAVSGSAMTIGDLRHGWGPLGGLPFWIQAVGILLVSDLAMYWLHRLKHRHPLWRFHAIHHSSEDLDWLSATRLHPVDSILSDGLRAALLLGLGFAPVAVAVAAPAFRLLAIGIHADLRWDFGPLRYVIASPAFHRWHHTSAEEGRDRNFAGLFPVYDLMFGTFYMPRHRPTEFGVDEAVPRGLWRQLVWPFRSDAARSP